ncbi:MAG: hypothetical protein M3495_10865 [Pseudomonadota bacterium]|nr:hypothetical protein [Gammaproteobacteria bacterium]MDQ3582070.1 hypothetical protein [Pseudomonadota bacterium]
MLPAALRRLDDWTLKQQPLLWRSRLVPALSLALPLAGLGLALGLVVPMTTQNVWTEAQIGNAVSLADMLMLIAIFFWARIQLRYAVGELRLVDQLHSAMYNVLAIAALSLPSQALHGALSYRVARVMPSQEFQEHWGFHQKWDFWCCSGKVEPAAVAAERERLDASLRRFGLSTDGEILPEGALPEGTLPEGILPEGQDLCPRRPAPCLLMRDTQGNVRPHLLAERLRSIATHQTAASAGVWQMLAFAVRGLADRAAAIGVAALLLMLLAVPRHVWPRRFVRFDPLSGRRRLELRLWLPQVLTRLDRRLLLHRPMFWATRAHVFLFHALTLGLVLSLLSLLLLVQLMPTSDLWDALDKIGGKPLNFYMVIGFFALSPILWALTCRSRHIPAVTRPELRNMTAAFFLANLPLPFLLLISSFLGGLMGGTAGPTDAVLGAAAFTLWSVTPVVAAALVANFSSRTDTLVGLAVGLPLMFGPLFLAGLFSLSKVGGTVFLAAVPLVWLIAERLLVRRVAAVSAIPSRRRLLLSAVLVTAAPAACINPSFAVYDGTSVFLKGESLAITTAISLLLLTLMVFGWGVTSCLQLLVRARYAPRDE